MKGFETSTETVFWDRRAFNLDCDDEETGALSSLREGICDIREGCELMESVVVVESRGLPEGGEDGKACPKEGGETFKEATTTATSWNRSPWVFDYIADGVGQFSVAGRTIGC